MKKKNNGLLKKIKLFFFSILDFSSKELCSWLMGMEGELIQRSIWKERWSRGRGLVSKWNRKIGQGRLLESVLRKGIVWFLFGLHKMKRIFRNWMN